MNTITPINCLIVDDSAITRMLVRRCIRLSGIPDDSLSEAANGREALTLLAAKKIDLVLADLHMPEFSGTQLIAAMQADPQLRAIPVIVISAEPSAQRIHQLLEQGASGYLQKPFSAEQFRSVLTTVLEKIHAPS